MPNKPKVNLDWSNITDEVIIELRGKIHQLILDTVGIDVDGDCGIQTIIINRDKYEPNYYVSVPYSHKITNSTQTDEKLKALTVNAQMACDAFGRYISTMKQNAVIAQQDRVTVS